FHQQTGANEKHQREGNLRDYEHTSDSVGASSARHTLAALFQRFADIKARRFERRNKSKSNSRNESKSTGKQQHGHVHGSSLKIHQLRRAECEQGLRAPPGEQQTERAAPRRQRNTFS